MNSFTQESLSLFYNQTIKGFAECEEKLKTQSEIIKKLEDQLNKINLEKAVEQTKNENLIYKLSVINDKVISAEQKVNELNTIMMKHFAYRTQVQPQVQPPTKISEPTTTGGFNFQPK